MFTRIVKMRFKPENIAVFEKHFDSIKEKVRNQPGCRLVILYQDKEETNVFFTYSIWEDESDLEKYRKSHFFSEVWQATKQLFEGKPEAWSMNEITALR